MIDFIRKTLIYFVNPKKKTSWFFYWFLKKILLINSWFFVKNYWFLNFGFGNPELIVICVPFLLIVINDLILYFSLIEWTENLFLKETNSIEFLWIKYEIKCLKLLLFLLSFFVNEIYYVVRKLFLMYHWILGKKIIQSLSLLFFYFIEKVCSSTPLFFIFDTVTHSKDENMIDVNIHWRTE